MFNKSAKASDVARFFRRDPSSCPFRNQPLVRKFTEDFGSARHVPRDTEPEIHHQAVKAHPKFARGLIRTLNVAAPPDREFRRASPEFALLAANYANHAN
jgi:hypothetical protein